MKTYKSKILAAVHGTASDLYDAGVITKHTMREFDESCLVPVPRLTPQEIRAIREAAAASQSVFARHLNVSPGLVSQWERGEKTPSGPALKLLALVQKKGLEAIA